MLSLGELSLFLPEDLYLVKNEETSVFLQTHFTPEQEDEAETETEEIIQEASPVVVAPVVVMKPVLFLLDKPLQGKAQEMFGNLISKALNLSESDYTVLLEEAVTFTEFTSIASQKIVSFGIPFSGYQTKYKNISTDVKLVLLVDSLDLIAENVDLKRQLWSQLQLMFPKNA